jgi:hypothetical protein
MQLAELPEDKSLSALNYSQGTCNQKYYKMPKLSIQKTY